MGDQAPRSRCSGNSESDQDRAGRRGPRRCRIILVIAGGLLGPGYWLCGSLWDGQVFGKSPTQIRFTEFVIASVVVVVASWGLLLILGEALLFALAVFKADDRERYDIYRNLMILWGYVLTLGIPRHFRKLPAQFGALPDDARSRGRAAGGGGQAGRRDGDRRDGNHRDGNHRDGNHRDGNHRDGRRPQERSSARDRTGSRQRGPRTDGGGRQAGEGAQSRRGSPETNPPEQAASLGPTARESAGPLGPIFPPRPAAEAEVAPVSGPSVPSTSVAGVPVPGAPVAVTVAPPSGESELRDALDLLMRYAARFGAGETVTPRPTGAEPGPPFGVVAETGGDP